jgi:hypothetical protein
VYNFYNLFSAADPEAKWSRGTRSGSEKLGHFFYDIDKGIALPLDGYEYRRLPLEFGLVGSFAVYASVDCTFLTI